MLLTLGGVEVGIDNKRNKKMSLKGGPQILYLDNTNIKKGTDHLYIKFYLINLYLGKVK